MQKEKVYHVYQKDNVLAHNLTVDELYVKLSSEELDLEGIEIIQLKPSQYTEASY